MQKNIKLKRAYTCWRLTTVRMVPSIVQSMPLLKILHAILIYIFKFIFNLDWRAQLVYSRHCLF